MEEIPFKVNHHATHPKRNRSRIRDTNILQIVMNFQRDILVNSDWMVGGCVLYKIHGCVDIEVLNVVVDTRHQKTIGSK